MLDTFGLVTLLGAGLGFLFGVLLTKGRILLKPATEIEALNAILIELKRAYKRKHNKRPKTLLELLEFTREAL